MNVFYNNKHTFRFFLFFLIFLFGRNGIAQTSITGKVTDGNTGEEMIAVNVMVEKDGVIIQGETTDIDGNYSIRVDAGIYDLVFSYTGYPTKKIEGVVVGEAEVKVVNVKLEFYVGAIIYCPILVAYKIPLIEQDKTSTGITITSEQIRNLPTRNINEIISITPGLSLTQ